MAADVSTGEPRQHVFDPYATPELFEGVRTRRIFAFFIDVIAIAILNIPAAVLIAILGIFTLGLGWTLFAVLGPGVALLYAAFTLGGPKAATPGMRAMGLEMRLWYGAKPYPLLAAVHLLFFWFSVTVLTPLVVLVSLFTDRKQLLHDLVLGTLVMNSDALRAGAGPRYP
jgi:uncharacterized RDD family membrane protein YckC